MSKYYIGGVATVSAFNNGEHLFTAKTLTDSSINISVSNEEIRGGEGAQLLGKFFHTTVFNLSLTDALFDFEYIMKQTGSELSGSTDTVTWKTYTATYNSNNSRWEITFGNGETPATLDFDGLYTVTKIIAWSDQYNLHSIELTQSAGNVYYISGGVTGVSTEATDFCVTCPIATNGTRQIKVNAMYYPAEFSLIMRAKLFSGDACKVSDGQAAGEVVIEIPRFQLDGTIDLAMAMTSPATYSLNGSALANGCGCDDKPWYAKITEVIYGSDPYAGYNGIVIDTDALGKGDLLGVYAFAVGKTPKPLAVGQYTVNNASVVNAAGYIQTVTAATSILVTANGSSLSSSSAIYGENTVVTIPANNA